MLAGMIEVLLELKFDSYLVNSTGESGAASVERPVRTLRFTCVKIVSSRQLANDTPTANFEFLSSSSKHEAVQGHDKEFDDKLLGYVKTHAIVDASRIDISPVQPDNRIRPETMSSGEIGKMVFANLPEQRHLDLDLSLKQDEFDDFWKLMTQQNIQKVLAALVCFKLKDHGKGAPSETTFTAGVLSCSLRMIPNL